MNDHPTVLRFRELQGGAAATGVADAPGPRVLDAETLRRLCLECGADDVGFVEVARPALDADRADIGRLFPFTKTLISLVVRMNRGPIRSPARSVANAEFHDAGDEVNDAARRIVAALEADGVQAVNPPMGFPMEADRWPGKMWVISHKPVAVAAGLGHMGIHRNVIHPRFGNFILLGTVLLDAEVSQYAKPLDYNPCLDCKLCVAACPVGAISPDHFDFAGCYHHNYREFMGGFAEWVETVADSKDGRDYRRRVSTGETVSTWQSLGFGPNYKAAYCLSVCPAGEDVIGPFLSDKGGFVKSVVKPLQEKVETLYVVPGSDAEARAAKRFPHKRRKAVRGSLNPTTVEGFLRGMPITFQREVSAGLDAVFHFTFTGDEARKATAAIRDKTLTVSEGHDGKADLSLTADSQTWLGFLSGDRNLLWALMTGGIRLWGSPLLLAAFGRCFPR